MNLTRSIRIPSIRSNIRDIEDFLLAIHDEVHFEESVLDRIMISVTEAVNNGIIHGNGANPEKFVELRCHCNDSHAEFIVRDEGEGFAPEEVPDPLDEQNLLKEGGRGLLIIRAMMDTVEFRPSETGMDMVLTISFSRPA
ncbi:MAG: ATP-binding protein [Ignavibacteria bacterium]|nr:ATP-binding protein [Ignavibacteria bacterium]